MLPLNLSLSACIKDSKCCISAGGTMTMPTDSPTPVRVFLAVGKACSDGPPTSSPTAAPSAGWIEASSITSLGGDDYQVTFPGMTTSDPRCVTPCDAPYGVCVWVYFADGTSNCKCESNFNPATYCSQQPNGVCTACA